MNKIAIAVIFGGRSTEHEVSVISALQAIENLDKSKYAIIPIYISKCGEMYTGRDLMDVGNYKNIDALLSRSTRIFLFNENGKVAVIDFKRHTAIGYIDVAMPIVHGTNVEDGALQGFLRTLDIPFTECDVPASVIGMDKHLQKVVVEAAGVPVLPCKTFTRRDYQDIDNIVSTIEREIGYPVIIKPTSLGSSVGISIANNEDELYDCIDNAYRYTDDILAEHAVGNLREINCSVLGDSEEAMTSVCEEPLHTGDFLTYEDKYGGSNSKGGNKGAKTKSGASEVSQGMVELDRKIPADITEQQQADIERYSIAAFHALNCSGVIRIDYILDGDTEEIYLNEINTIPGSLSFYLWEPKGLPYAQLLDKLVEIALKRHRREKALATSFDTHILDRQ